MSKCEFCDSESAGMFVTSRGPISLCNHDLEVFSQGYKLGLNTDSPVVPVTDKEFLELFEDVDYESIEDPWEDVSSWVEPDIDYAQLAKDLEGSLNGS